MKEKEFEQYKSQIKKCSLFKGMDEGLVKELMMKKSTVLLATCEGESLDGTEAYIVLEGCVLIDKKASDGRFVTMNRALPVSTVNVACAFTNCEAISRLTMQDAGVVIQVKAKTLKDFAKEHPVFALNLINFLSDRVCFLNKKITSLAGYSAGSRLGMYLKENAKDGKVTIPMNLGDFAEFLGVGRASLYRQFDVMEENGVIRRDGRTIEILEEI